MFICWMLSWCRDILYINIYIIYIYIYIIIHIGTVLLYCLHRSPVRKQCVKPSHNFSTRRQKLKRERQENHKNALVVTCQPVLWDVGKWIAIDQLWQILGVLKSWTTLHQFVFSVPSTGLAGRTWDAWWFLWAGTSHWLNRLKKSTIFLFLLMTLISLQSFLPPAILNCYMLVGP
jgi:hypothetical protein